MKLLRLVLSRSALAFVAGCFLWLTASAVHVRSYTKKDGTYVPAHERTAPNHTKNDNYSTKGNVNPYTGKEGTKPRDGETATTTGASTSSASLAPSTTATPDATTADSERVYITIPASAPLTDTPRPIPPLKTGIFSDLKGGMTEAQLFQVLGTPTSVEAKQNYEVWTYPTVTVYFSPKAGLLAWKENKWIIRSEKSVPAKPAK